MGKEQTERIFSFSFLPAQSAVSVSGSVEGFEVSVFRQPTQQPVVLITLSHSWGHLFVKLNANRAIFLYSLTTP